MIGWDLVQGKARYEKRRVVSREEDYEKARNRVPIWCACVCVCVFSNRIVDGR